jgi:hypothetical protein
MVRKKRDAPITHVSSRGARYARVTKTRIMCRSTATNMSWDAPWCSPRMNHPKRVENVMWRTLSYACAGYGT